ncbi:hypothetical protein SRABI83_03548 [Arthrobacter sp. Bi83]|nr:hypothetical protein SRABI83_03548 [Arthrobacter sp. Bi83]
MRLLIFVSLAGGLVMAMIAVVLHELGFHPGGSSAWLAFGLFPLFNLFSANVINFFRGKLEASGIATVKLTQALSWLVFCLVLVFTDQLSVTTAAFSMVASQIISATAGLASMGLRGLLHGRRDSTDTRAITSFSVRVFPGLAIRDLNAYLDQIVIAIFLSTRDLGLYAVAVSLTTSLALLSGPVINTVQPLIQSVHETERASAIARAYAATLIVIGIPATMLAASAPWIAPIIYGQEFSSSIFLIQILCAAALFDALNSCAHGALLGMNRPGRSSWSSSLGLVASILLWFLLLPPLGTAGAAVTSIVAYLIVQMFMFSSLKTVLRVGVWTLVVMILRAIPATFMDIFWHAIGLITKRSRRVASQSNVKREVDKT